MVGNNIKW